MYIIYLMCNSVKLTS